MYYNEPLAIAVDLEVTVDVDRLESKLTTDGDTLVTLYTDGRTGHVIVSDRFADMPPVADSIKFITGANGTECVQDFLIRLNLTAKELYAKLTKPAPQHDSLFYSEAQVKIYVDVVLLDDFLIIIQTAHDTVYEGGPARR